MRLSAVLAMLLFLGGCGPFRRAKAPPPPGPMPVRIPDQVTSMEPAPPPQNLPPPPVIGSSPVDAKAAPTAKALGLPSTPTAGPPRPVRKRRPAKIAAPPPAPPVIAETVEEAPPSAPPYRLGELRTVGEKEDLRRQTEELISVCGMALLMAEGRTLTPMQTELVGRVKSFSQQARDAIDKDPGEARGFAAKGRTFARALMAELR